MISSYETALTQLGIEYSPTKYWLAVRAPPVAQGWKLHISATPVNAERLIRTIGPWLRDTATSFKVGRDCDVLESLNAGQLGATQVGKFITVYPAPDRALAIARQVRELTEGFEGPAVPTDVRLGDVLYGRFGAFLPVLKRDRLGNPRHQIMLPDGSLRDDAYTIPHRVPEGVECPFEELFQARTRRDPTGHQGLFGPGYRIVDVLRETPKGGTFLAISLKDAASVKACVLKQGRPHCMSDRLGRDVRWRLKREFEVLRELSAVDGLPRAQEYFEVDGNAYLAIDYLPSRSIEETTASILNRRPWAEVELPGKRELLQHLAGLIEVVAAIHAEGFVHRDINNLNVRVGPSGQTYLFDFEMAHRVGDRSATVGLGTAGFVSPARSETELPDFPDDVYSLCCIAFLVITGIDPRRTLYVEADRRVGEILSLTGAGEELKALAVAIAGGLQADRSGRITLEQLLRAVRKTASALEGGTSAMALETVGRAVSDDTLKSLLAGAVEGLLHRAPRDQSRLWLSLPLGAGDQGVDRDKLELLRSAHCGISGVLYMLAQLARHGWGAVGAIQDDAQRAASWLLANAPTADQNLPGLHFGEAGVALSLHEAVAAGIVKGGSAANGAISGRLPGVLDWPDLSHGAAGQGLAALTVAPHGAAPCLDYLLRSQDQDGSWRIPEDAPALAGAKLTGFAHGCAGILYFIAEYGLRNPGCSIEPALHRGLAWLTQVAVEGGGEKLQWPYSATDNRISTWWCHGAPGIALCYLRAYEWTSDKRLLDIALRALRSHPAHVRYGNLSYCHGLCGLGEIYLEAYRVTRQPEWLARSRALLIPIAALARREGTVMSWIVEDPLIPVAALGLGLCSVIHFLLRLSAGPNDIALPLMPKPIARNVGV